VISPVHELEAAALALPLEERARLAERLLSSLDENAEDVDAAWVVEVRDRMARFRSGTLKAIPAEEVMADARKRATRR
jgi:putative addiction module component (TIGR02574 family)